MLASILAFIAGVSLAIIVLLMVSVARAARLDGIGRIEPDETESE